MKIILASASGVRKKILDDYKIDTEVVISNVDEDEIKKSLEQAHALRERLKAHNIEFQANHPMRKKPTQPKLDPRNVEVSVEVSTSSPLKRTAGKGFAEQKPNEYANGEIGVELAGHAVRMVVWRPEPINKDQMADHQTRDESITKAIAWFNEVMSDFVS